MQVKTNVAESWPTTPTVGAAHSRYFWEQDGRSVNLVLNIHPDPNPGMCKILSTFSLENI
jgi:hypothetical protein